MTRNMDQIEAYLAGTLEGEARERFERAVQNDPELAAELALYRDMAAALAPAGEDALRANLERLGHQFAPAAHKPHWWRWIAGFLFLLVVVATIWLNRGPGTTEAPAPPPTQDSRNGAPPVAQQTAPVIPSSPIQNQDGLRQKSGAVDAKTESRQLAAAFEPNPRLEPLLGDQMRGDDYRFRIVQPAEGATLKRRAGAADFSLSGTLETSATQVKAPFRMLLFSNKPRDYQDFRFILAAPLVFEKSDGVFRFRFSSPLRAQPGLYYYLIEDEESGQLYYVGKFRVAE